MGAAVFGGNPSLPLAFAASLSLEQIGIGTVFVLLLIPAALGIKSFVSKPKQEIANVPLIVKEAPKLVTKPECDLAHRDLERRVKALEENQAAIEQMIEDKFKALDDKRSHDVHQLHVDIEDTKDSLHKRVTDTTAALNDKIGKVPELVIDLMLKSKELQRK